MTPITVEFKDEAVTAALQRVAASLTDLTPLMEEMGEVLAQSTTDRFAKGKGPDGEAWAAKSAVTIETYRRRGDTVSLRPLIGPSGALSRTIAWRAGADFVEVGSNMVYAATMQFGAERGAFGARMGRTKPTEKRPRSQDYFMPIPWGDIPARPFLGLSEDDRGAIVAATEEWLARVAAGD